VVYQRLSSIAAQSSRTALLKLTLRSLARVDEKGNKVLYPGEYLLLMNNGPLAEVAFNLTGEQAVIDEWPQPEGNRTGKGVSGFKGY